MCRKRSETKETAETGLIVTVNELVQDPIVNLNGNLFGLHVFRAMNHSICHLLGDVVKVFSIFVHHSILFFFFIFTSESGISNARGLIWPRMKLRTLNLYYQQLHFLPVPLQIETKNGPNNSLNKFASHYWRYIFTERILFFFSLYIFVRYARVKT